MTLDDFLNSLPDDERETLTTPEIWNAALRAAMGACQSEIDVLKRAGHPDQKVLLITGAQGCKNAIAQLLWS